LRPYAGFERGVAAWRRVRARHRLDFRAAPRTHPPPAPRYRRRLRSATVVLQALTVRLGPSQSRRWSRS
jgi:hypothetical protein